MTCWVVSDGRAGMEKQCLALAGAVCDGGDVIAVKRISGKKPWHWLPPSLWWPSLGVLDTVHGDGLRGTPPPNLVIASGRQSVAPALTLRDRVRADGGTCIAVQIQNPGVLAKRFDLVVAPAHDKMRGANVMSTMGAIHNVTPETIDGPAADFAPLVADLPRPLVAVLLGGPNRVYDFTDAVIARLAEHLAAITRDHGAGLAVTASRRTPPAVLTAITAALGDSPAVIWKDGPDQGDNPYMGFLGLADVIVVTGDSVNMVSEAAGTGKPVYVAALAGGSAKFAHFHQAMQAAGITRPLSGALDTWRYDRPDDTARAAGAVRALLRRNTTKS